MTSHFSISLLSGFFKIVSRSTSALSMSILLNKYLAFRKSWILYNNCVLVSLNSWPKFVLSSISFEIHENTSYGMSTVNSPSRGLASFGWNLDDEQFWRGPSSMLWRPCHVRATAAGYCYPWVNLSSRIPMAPLSSLKKSLTIFIPSPLESSLKQSDLARCKPGRRDSANLTLAAILDFTQATLRALNDLFQGWFGAGVLFALQRL